MISSSSSNRTPGQCDAVLTTGSPGEPSILSSDESTTQSTGESSTESTPTTRHATGPLRLPLEDPGSFVTRFNRIYASIGLSVKLASLPDSCPPTTNIQRFAMSDEITPESLRQKKCVPCEGGVPVIDTEASNVYMQSLPNWSVDDGGKRISRQINAGNFVKAMDLMQRIAELSELEQHHPDLHLTGYRNLRIELTTHAIGGLSENDFVIAAKIDTLLD